MSGQYITTEEDLELTQKNDKIKNKYAKSKGIKMIRISYEQTSNINKILNEKII
jgi:hypothetical protein